MFPKNLNNEIKLSPREREIAIEAIGRAPIGDRSLAAADLLAGIAVLGGAHLPVLVWPADMPNEKKATWLEGEASAIRATASWELEIKSSLERERVFASASYREFLDAESPSALPDMRAPSIQSGTALREEPAEAVRATVKMRDLGASDASE